jgi:hypothetical protein
MVRPGDRIELKRVIRSVLGQLRGELAVHGADCGWITVQEADGRKNLIYLGSPTMEFREQLQTMQLKIDRLRLMIDVAAQRIGYTATVFNWGVVPEETRSARLIAVADGFRSRCDCKTHFLLWARVVHARNRLRLIERQLGARLVKLNVGAAFRIWREWAMLSMHVEPGAAAIQAVVYMAANWLNMDETVHSSFGLSMRARSLALVPASSYTDSPTLDSASSQQHNVSTTTGFADGSPTPVINSSWVHKYVQPDTPLAMSPLDKELDSVKAKIEAQIAEAAAMTLQAVYRGHTYRKSSPSPRTNSSIDSIALGTSFDSPAEGVALVLSEGIPPPRRPH